MHNNKNENIFDKDDALDFIIYEEFEQHDRKNDGNKKSGCLGGLILMLIPVGLLVAVRL